MNLAKDYSHTRTKPVRVKAANAEEKAHFERIKKLGCFACGTSRRVEIHHEHRPGARRDHRKTVSLCFGHHQAQGLYSSRHNLGRQGFNEHWDMDIEALAEHLWGESMRILNG